MKYKKDKDYTFIFTHDMYFTLKQSQPWPYVNSEMSLICDTPCKFYYASYNNEYQCNLFKTNINGSFYFFKEEWLKKVNRSSAIKRNTNVSR